ncbi:MAG: trigger factor [Gammaproteobacteria bacterium]|nr:trigger factor [Gammaproteobacteria bacterium]
MQSTIRPTGPIERNLHVIVEEDEINRELDEQVKSVAVKAALPGFRKGNVPRNLIRERYGKSLLAEIKVKKTEESLRDAIEKHKIRVAHIANLNYLSDRNETSLEYFVDLVTEPDLIIDKLENLNIVKPVSDVTDADLDKQLEHFLDQRCDVEYVDGPIESGQFVGYTVKDLGSKIFKDLDGIPGLQDMPYTLHIGGNSGLANDEINRIISDELVGRAKKDIFVIEREIELMDRPDATKDQDDHELSPADPNESDEEFGERGKLHAEILVESVQIRTRPVLNDEFFSSLDMDVSNLEELRDRIRNNLSESLKRRADSLVHQQIVQQLTAMNPVDIPLHVFQRGHEDHEQDATTVEAHKNQLIQDWIIQQYASKNDVQVEVEELNKALMVQHQVRTAMGQSTDILYTEGYQRRTQTELLTRKVLTNIVEKLDMEERSTSVDEFNEFVVDDELQESQPNGGPYSWTSPATDDEIKQGREEVEALRSRLKRSEDEEQVEEQTDDKEAKEGKQDGIFKRIWNLVGGKK